MDIIWFLLIGVGAGWLREEYAALDADFDARGPRMEEAIAAMRAAWAAGPAEYHGEQIAFESVEVEPKPCRAVPIVIGGHSEAAARRAGRLADGFFPLACQGERLAALVSIVHSSAIAAGRDPSSIELTVEAPRTPQEARAQIARGVTRVVVNAPNVVTDDLGDVLEQRLAAVRGRFADQ